MIKLAIFDLDGTVCNTIDDLANATNYAMQTLGYPTHTVEEYKYFVGNGMYNLVYRALPEDKRSDKDVAYAKELMLSYYGVHFADKSKPYDGIMELLKALKENGVHIACCTNKAHHMAKEIADKIFVGIFEEVSGHTDSRPLKPDPCAVYEMMDKFDATPEQTVFIGDSGVDMQTALNSNTSSIGVLWGFRDETELKQNGAQHIAETPKDIFEIIQNL